MNFKKILSLGLLGLSLSAITMDAFAGHRHGHRGHRHGHRHGHGHGSVEIEGDGALFSLGALLGSLAVSTTSAAVEDDYKMVLDQSDRILEQVMDRSLPTAFYDGIRSSEELMEMSDLEIDLMLIETLGQL